MLRNQADVFEFGAGLEQVQSMSSVVIVPGLRNSGPQHWQTLWQQRLPNAERIRLRQWDQPDLQSWVEATIAAVRRSRACYVVAHSFGCLATVAALDAIQQQVRGVLLVAPADPDKFNLAALLPHAPLPVPGVVVGSLSDPWLAWSKAQQWAQRWELPIFCAGNAGHINAESGHTDWSEGWALLQRLQQQEVFAQHEVFTPVSRTQPALRWSAVTY